MSSIPTFKTCPECGTQTPGDPVFCVECGASLADVPPTTGLMRAEQTQFSLPEYLREEQYRRSLLRGFLADDTGTGSGLIWTGVIVGAASVVFTEMNALGVAALALGVLMVIAGFWRMRPNPEALSRAGLAIVALAAVCLGAVLFQALGPRQAASGSVDRDRAAVAPTANDARPAPVANADPDGAVAMYGGTANHAGVHPGPAPVGRPVTKWRQFTGGEVYSSPVVVDGTLYLGTKSGFLAAYDVATGSERWRFDLGGYIVRATPAVADGVAYVGAGYGLYAIDVATGNELWRFPIRFAGTASPNVADGMVFIATQEGHVYAVDAATGKEDWHYEADGLIFGAPAIFDGRVYFASDTGGVHVLQADSGRLVWRKNSGLQIRGAPAVDEAGAFFNTEQPALLAYDSATGDELWQTQVGGEASPAVSGQTVLFGSDENGLYAADTATGEVRWLFPTGSAVLTAPAVAGDSVFVSSGSTLYAINVETGQPDWTYPAGDVILTTPAVVDGVVYFGSRDGFLYAVSGDGLRGVDES